MCEHNESSFHLLILAHSGMANVLHLPPLTYVHVLDQVGDKHAIEDGE